MKANTSWQIIDYIAAPVLVLDDEGYILHVNPAANKISEDDFREGSDFYALLDPEQTLALDLGLESNKQLSPALNLEVTSPSGERIRVSLQAERIPAVEGGNFHTLITLTKLAEQPILPSTNSLEDLEWLANQGRIILSLDNQQEILDAGGEALQNKLGDCIVISLSKIDESNLRLVGVHGIRSGLLDRVWKMVGGDFFGREFPIDNRFRDSHATRSLYKHPGGFAEFAISQMPARIAEKLSDMVGLQDIYAIGLTGNRQLMGCFYIFTLKTKHDLPVNLIESYVSQLALALEKSICAADMARSEKKFQALFEHAPDAYYLTDSHGTFLAGNKAAEEIIGFGQDEIIGKNMVNAGMLSRSQLTMAGKLLARNILGLATGPDEFILTRKDGSDIPIEIHNHPIVIDDERVILGIARDISARKQTEENQIKAHDTLTRVLEGIDAHVYVADLSTSEILYMNKCMIEDFGGDFTGKICYQVFLDRSSKCPHCTNDQILDSRGYPGDVVVWKAHNPKTDRWYKNFDRAIYWTNQQLVKLQIAVDITDTMESSRALEESENRYRNLFENSHNALMTLAPPEWDFQTGNTTMMEMFQIEDHLHLMKIKPWELSPEFQPDGKKSQKKAREMIQIAVEKGSHFFEWTHKKLTGDEFPATVQLSRVDLGDEYILQATVRDISARIRAEKIMQHQMGELDLLNKLNEKANQGCSIGEILDLFGQETKKFFGAVNAHVFLLDPESNQLEVALFSPSDELRQSIKQVLDIVVPDSMMIDLEENSGYGEIIRNGKEVILTSQKSIIQLMKEMFATAIRPTILRNKLVNLLPVLYSRVGIQSVALVPIISEETVIGLVDLVLPYQFNEKDLNSLRSITKQLSVIIQRIRADEERLIHLTENEFITRSLVESAKLEDIDLICSNLADNVLQLNPDVYVMISLYDPEINAIRIRAVKGMGLLTDRLVKILGKRPEEVQIDALETSIDDELNQISTSGKLELVPGGLHELTRRTISEQVCQSIEKLTGVKEVYYAGFGLRGRSAGGLVILTKKGVKIKYPAAIETAVSHFSVIFERRIAQDEIVRRKAQLESLRNVELNIASKLNLEELLQTIALEARSIVNAVACGFSIYNPERSVLEVLAYTGVKELPENSDIACGEGFSGTVWEKKETLIIENYAHWENRSEDWVEMGNYHLAGIPVIWGDEVLGVLEIAIDLAASFSPGDIRTLERFATQAAIAVKNARLFHEEMLRRQEAETLREVGLLINRMMDRDELLNMILSALQNVVPYHGASLQLVQGNDIVIEAYQGTESRDDLLGYSYTIKENKVSQDILFHGKKIVLETKEQVQEILQGPDTELTQSWMAIPLEVKQNRIGIITLDHQEPHQYSSRELSLVTDFATQVAIALENNRLFDEIRRRTQEIEVVYESAMKLTQELHPDLLFEHLYQQIESMFEQDAFVLATYNESEKMIDIEYASESGLRQPQYETMRIPLEEKNSLLGWILRKKTPLLIGNVEKDSLPVRPQQNGKAIWSWLGVPLMVGERLIGALVVQSYRPYAYQKEDQRLLELLGNQVAIALENSRLFADAQQRLFRLSSLREIDMTISGSVDLKMTMEVLISQLRKSLNVDAACVLAYNPINHTLDFVSGRGFQTNIFQDTSLKVGKGLAGKAAQERSLVHIPDLREKPTSLEKSPLLSQENFVTYLAHPLIAKGDLVGVLEVYHRERLDPDQEWIHFLDALARVAGIAIDRLNLFNELSRSNFELQRAYDATIEGWARAIEMRDHDTSKHSRRVVALTMNLARKLGIDGENLTHIRRGAMLHDIGKMAIPDGILLKAGKLSDDEWQLMKKHPQYAFDMMSTIDYLAPAIDIPYCHHERWDGSGYPQGLSGDQIPLAARIFAIVDVWDALQSDRPYREAWSEDKAVAYLKEQAGSHFDPQIVSAFLDLINKR